MALFPRMAADTVILAWKRLQNCTLTYGIGQESSVAFNRNYVLTDGAIVTNPAEFVDQIVRPYSGIDPDLPVLTIWNEAGQQLCVLYTYALHSDTTGKLAYSGDFSSEVSKQLKKRYGSDFVSIYLAGFCGDINHVDYINSSQRNHRDIGGILAAEIIRVSEEGSQPVSDDTVSITYRQLTLQRRRATKEQIEQARYYVANPGTKKYDMTGSTAKLLLMYEETCGNCSNDVSVPLQVMRLGDVYLYICPLEMYHQYAQPLKAAAPSGKWLITELANMEASYVPVPELLSSDCYEAQLCYGSWMEPYAGDKLTNALAEMAKELN